MPATLEFFGADKSVKSGLKRKCRACGRAACKDYFWRLREEKDPGARERHEAPPKGYDPAKRRAYYLLNKDHAVEVSRKWYQRNKDKAALQGRKWKAANAERVKELRRATMARNPEKYRAHRNKRRALKLQAEGVYTDGDVFDQLRRQKNKCYWCGCKLTNKYHVDHIVPLSRGGSNWPENIVVACVHCNESKLNKLPHEWPQGGRLL